MNFFKYTFNEDEWGIYLIEDDDDVIADENAAAVTKFDDKELYFRRGDIGIDVILHELWHVYFGYCFLGDTNEVSLADMEEISAALFSHKAYRILEVTEDLYSKLCMLRDKKKGKK